MKPGLKVMTSKYARATVLAELASGARGIFRGVEAGRGITSRLAALGLVAGSPVEVLQNSGRGPVLVRVHNTRVALGRTEARKVLIEIFEE
ncbi:MAG TPA: FeoA family protein [Terriglobales bacterium]|jgi:ferrous iron transport protein A|nr:FeoA family protein [Terriglobales bacterium]